MAKIIALEETDSTMLALERLLKQGELSSLDGVLAYKQTQGRGRLQRAWKTGQGENLAITFWVQMEASQLYPLPLVVALAVIDTLSARGLGGRLRCKWPNDVHADSKKICGILCQYAENAEGQAGSAVGIGVNLGLSAEELQSIDQPATSLEALTGQSAAPLEVAEQLQQMLAQRVQRLQSEGFGPQAAEWYQLCAHRDGEVRVNTGFETIAGQTLGVSEQGALILDCGGQQREIICGDVSKVSI